MYFVDFGPCVKIPLTICEENILHMLDNLTEFEEEFPAIAFALQSNRAARRILNRVQIVLDRFKEKSLILKEDIIILKKILFEMTKKVAYAPRIRPVIHDISKILEESDWIRFSDASKIILENHTICSYRRGEVIHKVGKHHQWVHIIASGIVKVLWNNAESKTSPHQMYNKLPNTDTLLFFDLKDEKEIWDFLVTSQTLGLLGYLQKN
ncbi:hypothetical protein TNCT_208611 [Trichonephila clavata]|uniref:Cyclic nucleotide-binding domain-containing protein n=1 Tax=Trichonephila clavata TaxID=2740835 RepID=A0A8X6H851_TRICU|nr:hypothetical protein TNCT_208611 [Trichonephila clavata]